MKNIYDLEGNCYELTAQASDSEFRVDRGGVYYDVADGHFIPASDRRYGDPSDADSSGASRVTLYVTL